MTVYILAIVSENGDDLQVEAFSSRELAEQRGIEYVIETHDYYALDFDSASVHAYEKCDEWIVVSEVELDDNA